MIQSLLLTNWNYNYCVHRKIRAVVHTTFFELNLDNKKNRINTYCITVCLHCLILVLLGLIDIGWCFAAEEREPRVIPDTNFNDKQKCESRGKLELQKTRKILFSLDLQSLATKEALLDKLIKIGPSIHTNSDVSCKFVDAIKTGLRAYPKQILALLTNNKYEVHLGRLVTICLPELIGRHPRGYRSKEATYDTAGAIFARRKKWIIIGEYSYRQKELVPTPEYEHTAQHEVGHAVDKLLGYPSHSAQFFECYQTDSRQIPINEKKYLTYFLQAGNNGPQETFAELLASKYGDPLNKREFHIQTAFPRCSAFVEQILPKE